MKKKNILGCLLALGFLWIAIIIRVVVCSPTFAVCVHPIYPHLCAGLWSNWNNPRGSVECPTGNICFEYRTRRRWNFYCGARDGYWWVGVVYFGAKLVRICNLALLAYRLPPLIILSHQSILAFLTRNRGHKVESNHSSSNYHMWSPSQHATISNHA